ncbi:MAG: hypothetical protein ACLQKK_08460 [Rhodomicrobium sp.]
MTGMPYLPPLEAAELSLGEADLIFAGPGPYMGQPKGAYCRYEVCTPVLSDCGIVPGEVLALNPVSGGERVQELSVAAVRLELGRDALLLLRLLVPPRLLIANSALVERPPLIAGRYARVLAARPLVELATAKTLKAL